MQDLVIRGRRGNTISIAEYPAGHVDAVNARLDVIASEVDDLTTVEATA